MLALRRVSLIIFAFVLSAYSMMGIGDLQNGVGEVGRQQMYWQTFQQRFNWSKRVHFDLQWHHRWISGGDQQWIAPRVRAHYHFNPQLYGSIGFVHFGQTNLKQVLYDGQQALSEFRFQQEVDHVIRTERFSWFQRLVVEERFVQKRSSESKERAQFAYGRLRYRLGFQFKLGDFENLHITAKIHNEVMFNAGHRLTKRAFDQNRIFAGIAVKFSRQLTTEIGYMHWFQQHISNDGFTRRDIIHIGVTHTFDLKNKQ